MSKQITIYLLHGWAVDPHNEQKWQMVREELRARHIETIFLALPGLTTPLEKPWDLADYCIWLSGVLPADKPVLLLGHSFGGQLAVRFAALHPEQVSKLILIDSSGIRDATLLAKLKRVAFQTLAHLGKQLTHSPFARQLLYSLAREKDYFSAPPVMRETMARVIADEILTDLPRVQAQTLIIWGSNDRITPLKNTVHFSKIPASTVRVVPAARHSPQFTHPAEVARLITEFVYA